MIKADGSIAVHCDAKAYKPLNWMNPPCTISEHDDVITATNPKGETLIIELHEMLFDERFELGTDPGSPRTASKPSSRSCSPPGCKRSARTSSSCGGSTRPTSGPSTCCAAMATAAVVVEVKRVGEIAGVEQLLRYQERLDLDGTLAPTRGMFVATRIKPQARVFAESRGVECVEIDLDTLRADAPPDLKLF